tara:strand:- start:268 stop:909 length:642 start_codon:yes stop_codon:yes gene_type:complete
MKKDMKKHWEEIYCTKDYDEVSWYQTNPKTSINLILSANLDKESHIIDVGGGDSNLVDNLLNLGFKNISVLDISKKALEKSQQRLGEKAKIIKWIESDITDFDTENKFDIWHDRAVFHFLTSEEDIKKYADSVKKLLKPEGFLIISTFSIKGPEKCSGLNVTRYSEETMKKLFEEDNRFEHIKSLEEIHNTPFQTNQCFIYNVFKKINYRKQK